MKRPMAQERPLTARPLTEINFNITGHYLLVRSNRFSDEVVKINKKVILNSPLPIPHSQKGKLMRYLTVIEKATKNYSAYVPDLPGCVATGDTIEEVELQIKEAIEFHIEGLEIEGLPIPEPTTLCKYVEYNDGKISA